MYYSKIECPHCGNEFTVNSGDKIQKCCWCKRMLSVQFKKISKKKQRFDVQPADFTEEQKKIFFNKRNGDNIDG